MKTSYYLRRISTRGDVFFLGVAGEWRVEWQGSIGRYKMLTFSSLKAAKQEAARLASVYPAQSLSVMTNASGTARVVDTFVRSWQAVA